MDSQNMLPVTLYIVRHGETEYNIAGLLQGWCDSPLTAKGVSAAENVGRRLKGTEFTAVYSSDSGRACRTAQLIMENAGLRNELVLDNNLREWHLGALEGTSHHGKRYREVAMEKGEAAGYPGCYSVVGLAEAYYGADPEKKAELYHAASKRIMGSINQISQKAAEAGGGNVLIVSHGMSIVTMVVEMRQELYTNLLIANASVTKVVYVNGAYKIMAISDTSYCEKGAELDK